MFRQVAGLIAGMVPHRAHLRESPPISLPESDALSEASRSSLGYEPTDVRLLCLGQSLVTALTSADLRREVVPGLLHLSRLSLSRRVRFTNRFTEPVLDLRLSALPRARPRALRPVGSSAHRRPPAPRAGQNRRFYSP